MILCFSDKWQDTRCGVRCKQKYFILLRKFISLKYIAKIINVYVCMELAWTDFKLFYE